MVVAGVTLPQSYEVGGPHLLISYHLISCQDFVLTLDPVSSLNALRIDYKPRGDLSFPEILICLLSCSTRTNPPVVFGVLGLCEEPPVRDLWRRFGTAGRRSLSTTCDACCIRGICVRG